MRWKVFLSPTRSLFGSRLILLEKFQIIIPVIELQFHMLEMSIGLGDEGGFQTQLLERIVGTGRGITIGMGSLTMGRKILKHTVGPVAFTVDLILEKAEDAQTQGMTHPGIGKHLLIARILREAHQIALELSFSRMMEKNGIHFICTGMTHTIDGSEEGSGIGL